MVGLVAVSWRAGALQQPPASIGGRSWDTLEKWHKRVAPDKRRCRGPTVPRRRKTLIPNRGRWCSLSLLRHIHLGDRNSSLKPDWVASHGRLRIILILCTQSAIYPACSRLDIRGILQPWLFHECQQRYFHTASLVARVNKERAVWSPFVGQLW